MSSTFMDHNAELIKSTLGEIVAAHRWTFAIAYSRSVFFFLARLLQQKR
jgi:anaerobic C4-dicarboxylate transporter